jgi:hypothetical protein
MWINKILNDSNCCIFILKPNGCNQIWGVHGSGCLRMVRSLP